MIAAKGLIAGVVTKIIISAFNIPLDGSVAGLVTFLRNLNKGKIRLDKDHQKQSET